MAGYIEDRWLTKKPDPDTGERRRTARWGVGKRYRVKDVPAVRDRSFERLTGPHGANAWLARAQHESVKDEFIDPRDGRVTLADYFEEYWSTREGDPGTLETQEQSIRKHIIGRLGHMPLNSIKVPQLRQWLKDLGQELGPGTIGLNWGYLSSLLQAAVEDERIRKNPCRAKSIGPPPPAPKKARAWTRARIRAVQAEMDPRFRILVDLGVGAGLRQGEAIGLAVDDIDTAAGVLHIRRQLKKVHNKLVYALPKGEKTRDVPLPRHLAGRLDAHMREFPAKKVTLPWGNPDVPETDKQAEERAPQSYELVVTATQGGPVRRDSWNERYWKSALVHAGVITAHPDSHPTAKGRQLTKFVPSREHGFHVLRHTFASVMLDAREPIVAVSNWLGHADASITLRIYAHMMPEADGRGRTAMDSWFEADS
ncbi:tyrosine-type recombinase/integrase [Streptomyces sp. BH104]|uniref:tyrosine-type recombinase/integrase n=1 Tax=Streptomyces sp. BH104 TaxID=3410407 RepID=UPI003BB7DCFD